MALVEYSDSENDERSDQSNQTITQKRGSSPSNEQDHAKKKTLLPPLPTTFHDLYSSTVRTSTQDDASLHGGRTRIKPHVQGNWPTHVYLEWHPSPEETSVLQSLLSTLSSDSTGVELHSLLTNALSVPLPLHISLSRPLTLKTEQKDVFLSETRAAVSHSQVRKFECKANKLRWHPNELGTRWFLVLVVEEVDGGGELRKLLKGCNDVARSMGLDVLYGKGASGEEVVPGKFHVSLAWTLAEPKGAEQPTQSLRAALAPIGFEEVKIRIGQDVSVVALSRTRARRHEAV